jgi:hypothetical protein
MFVVAVGTCMRHLDSGHDARMMRRFIAARDTNKRHETQTHSAHAKQ